MFKKYLIVFVMFIAFASQGCAILEFCDGSSSDEIKKFRVTKEELLAEIEQLKEDNKQSQLQTQESQNQIQSQNQTRLHSLKQENNMLKEQLRRKQMSYNTRISELNKKVEDRESAINETESKSDLQSVSLIGEILFDFSSDTLTPMGKSILNRISNVLKSRHGKARIRIEGHTDNVPIRKEALERFSSNWALSVARAVAVAHYLQKERGIDPEDLEVMGLSFYKPAASNKSISGRSKNRRVELVLVPKV